jgi:hypothetical protein
MEQYGDQHLMLGACCNLEITPALSLALHHSDGLLYLELGLQFILS